jgi:ribonuclease HI
MVHEFGAGEAETTNNRMELQTAIVALEMLHDYQHVTVVTDSRYVLDGITKWLRHWRQRGWVTRTGMPVKNDDLWQRLAQLQHAGIHWQHVRGHSGEPHNERADAIARAFASGSSPHLFHGHLGAQDDPVVAQFLLQPVSPTTNGRTHRPGETQHAPRYVSIVRGVVAVDDTWSKCAARVHGVSGACYKKINSAQELAAFCAEHGVDLPPYT